MRCVLVAINLFCAVAEDDDDDDAFRLIPFIQFRSRDGTRITEVFVVTNDDSRSRGILRPSEYEYPYIPFEGLVR